MKNKLFNKPYIIAEIGSNHNQSINLAKKTIVEAKKSGADAVKFQFFDGRKLYPNDIDMQKKFKKYEFNRLWIKDLLFFCKKKKIDFFFSVFDTFSLKYLKKFKFSKYKIASSEATNYELLKELSKINKIFLLSTGMCDLDDVEKAVKYFKNKKLVLMQCHSDYPLKEKDANIAVLAKYKRKFPKLQLGFSDHTLSNHSALIALGFGALVFEKHFTLNKKFKGPDHFYSYEPKEFKKYVDDIRRGFICLGSGEKKLINSEITGGRRLGIYAKQKIKKNTILKKNLIYYKSPIIGIRKKYLKNYLNKTLIKDVGINKPILKSYFK